MIISLVLIPTETAIGATIEPSTPAQEDLFEACDKLDETALRDELNTVSQQALSQNNINIAQIVQRQWLAEGMDALLDAEVDRAIEKVRGEEDYLSRLWSGWSADKAKELTGKVATYALGSQNFKDGIDRLSTGIADEVAAEIESASARTASSALICLQSFIGGHYSQSLVSLFEADIAQEVAAVDIEALDVDVSMLETHSSALAGIGVIIATQIAKRLAKKLAQRLAGKIIGRIVGRAAASLIPIAGWIIGAGLIVWDLVEGSDGALPQIQEALKGSEVKAEIRSQTVEAIQPELERELPLVARDVAEDVFSSWIDFKQRYETVLALAEENRQFRDILDAAQAEEIYKLARLVTTGLDAIGKPELVNAIESGAFERIAQLPESATDILESSKSIHTVVEWSTLAGSRLDDVVALEIYKLKMPADFDRDSLSAILALGDKATVAKVLLLDTQASTALLGLPTETLKSLAASFSVDDLDWLAAYLTDLDNLEDRNQLVAQLLTTPAMIEELKDESVKEAITTGGDVGSTLDFLTSPRSVQSFLIDSMTAWNGGVSWYYHYRKYTVVWLGAIALLALLILRLVWWYLKPFIRSGI